MILVWGSTDDAPVTHVLDALAFIDCDTFHLDDAAIPTVRYDLRLGPRPSGWFEVGDRRIHIREVEAIYLRPGEQTGTAVSTSAALLAVAGSVTATVVNRPAAGRSNLSKPFQLSLIADAGFGTPDTLVTSDVSAARDFLSRHGRIVYKSISGCRSIVSVIDAASKYELDRMGHGPVQLQQWIDGLDVRVHVVGERSFATSIASPATDYRYVVTGEATLAVAPFDLPEGLARKLVALVQGMGLIFAGIDLRLTRGGDWVCFEVNPSPGFTYYEDQTGQPIARAIAELLVGADHHHFHHHTSPRERQGA